MNPENSPLKSVRFSTEQISIWCVLALIFLLPIFFIPSPSFPLLLAKNVLVTALSAVALLAWLAGVIKNGKISLPNSLVLVPVVLLPLVYFVSAMTSANKSLSLFGSNLEIGTFSSVLVMSILLGLVSLVLIKRVELFKAHTALFASFFLVSLFGIVKLFSAGSLEFSNFVGVMGNPVGAWTDYAMYFGLFAVLSALALDFLPRRKLVRRFLYISFAISLFFLAVVNFSIAWILVLILALVLIIYSLTRRTEALTEESKRINPLINSKYTFLLAIVSLLFVINPVVSPTNGTLGNTISSVFGVQNAEVRPSFSATWDVTKPVLKADPILGMGPNTFSKGWLMNKPDVINNTAFWNVAFPFGIGFLPTQVLSVGILGSLVWIGLLLAVLALGYKGIISRSPTEAPDKFIVLSSFFGTVFLWVGATLYVPSITMLTLGFIFTGMFFASLTSTGVISLKTIVFSADRRANMVAMLIALLVVLGTLGFGFKIFQKTLSAIYFQQALVGASFENQNVDWVQEKIVKALTFSEQDIYYRALSNLAFTRAQTIINSNVEPTAETAQEFQSALSQSIAFAQSATNVNPENYENWVALGGIYEALVPAPLEVEGSYESAKSSYEEARKYNPKSAEIPLILARLELAKGNSESARSYIEESLTLKNDYAAAYFLLARMAIEENNLANAISAAEAGASLSPGNAGVFFELGLLKYTNKDFVGAVGAFTEAIRIVPDYANAQYFLGLSHYELGQTTEALSQFEKLLITNPDNEEVMMIIENLRAGRTPFYPSTTTTASPAERTTPPIE